MLGGILGSMAGGGGRSVVSNADHQLDVNERQRQEGADAAEYSRRYAQTRADQLTDYQTSRTDANSDYDRARADAVADREDQQAHQLELARLSGKNGLHLSIGDRVKSYESYGIKILEAIDKVQTEALPDDQRKKALTTLYARLDDLYNNNKDLNQYSELGPMFANAITGGYMELGLITPDSPQGQNGQSQAGQTAFTPPMRYNGENNRTENVKLLDAIRNKGLDWKMEDYLPKE